MESASFMPILPPPNEFSHHMTQLVASMMDLSKGKADRRVQVLLLFVKEKTLRLLCPWEAPMRLCCGVHLREQ